MKKIVKEYINELDPKKQEQRMIVKCAFEVKPDRTKQSSCHATTRTIHMEDRAKRTFVKEKNKS